MTTKGAQLHPDTGVLATSLLVALDGSAFAERAIGPAGRLAARLGVPLCLWSVAPTATDAEARRPAIAALAKASGARCELLVGERPADAIVSAAGAAGGHPLVCLATHGRDHSAPLVHSTSAALVAASAGPVLLVGPAVPAEPPAPGRLAVCVDGNPESDDRIMVAAMAWAGALDLGVTVLTVAEPVPESIRNPGSYPRLHGPHGDADAYVASLAGAWNGDVPVSGRAVYDPVDVDGALVRAFAADPTELVVMGTRAPRGLRRLILGSTAAAVAHGSPAPVLVVPL